LNRTGRATAYIDYGSQEIAIAAAYRVITSWLNRSQPARLPHPAPRLIVFPYATLFYVLAYSPVSGGVGGWGWIFVVLGIVFDIGHWVGGGVTGRQRYASA
jgi:hypothetical protein